MAEYLQAPQLSVPGNETSLEHRFLLLRHKNARRGESAADLRGRLRQEIHG